jgi:uncharacterized membrane protein YfcA
MLHTLTIAALIFVAALLYSSVGHAGASGYLAVMGFFKLPQAVMRPAALVLNVVVASIGTWRFWRAGHLQWRLLWPFVVLSAPFAFYGGKMRLSAAMYQRVLGIVLLLAAAQLVWQTIPGRRSSAPAGATRPPPIPVAMIAGAALGLLAGLTGVGGGIFLSPLLILAKWADPKKTAGVSVAFILVNSIAGLAGQAYSGQFNPLKTLPVEFLAWAVAAVIGGWIGSSLGALRLGHIALRRVLALVLIIAGVKLLWS